jgi:hypothetical protein
MPLEAGIESFLFFRAPQRAIIPSPRKMTTRLRVWRMALRFASVWV